MTSEEWLLEARRIVADPPSGMNASRVIEVLREVTAIAILNHQMLQTQKQVVVDTIGGSVEGRPTAIINYLQRLRELVRNEETLRAYERANELALRAMEDAVADEQPADLKQYKMRWREYWKLKRACELTELDAALPSVLNPCLTRVDRASRVWRQIADRLGFDWRTARPVDGAGKRVFAAVPLDTF
jgi:hypothetical protein